MTYEDIKDLIGDNNLPVSSTNENGETVVIEDGKTEDGECFYQLTTIQKNDWCRINTYYADGTVDETYER